MVEILDERKIKAGDFIKVYDNTLDGAIFEVTTVKLGLIEVYSEEYKDIHGFFLGYPLRTFVRAKTTITKDKYTIWK